MSDSISDAEASTRNVWDCTFTVLLDEPHAMNCVYIEAVTKAAAVGIRHVFMKFRWLHHTQLPLETAHGFGVARAGQNYEAAVVIQICCTYRDASLWTLRLCDVVNVFDLVLEYSGCK